jgi:hypothetical protein
MTTKRYASFDFGRPDVSRFPTAALEDGETHYEVTQAPMGRLEVHAIHPSGRRRLMRELVGGFDLIHNEEPFDA